MHIPPSIARLARALGVLAVVLSLSLARPRPSHAESAPSLPGFATLGQVLVDKSGCPSCPLVLATEKRHRVFAFASDSPFPVLLSGRVEVTCAGGASYHVFLSSPRGGGPFQIVPNTCPNLESKEITLVVTSVGLSPADAERKVALIAYGSFG